MSGFRVDSTQSLPLMFLVLGELVDNFTGYFIPGSGVTKEQFMDAVGRNS